MWLQLNDVLPALKRFWKSDQTQNLDFDGKCRLISNLVCYKIFKPTLKLSQFEKDVLLNYFKSDRNIPWIEMTMSNQFKCCAGCGQTKGIKPFQYLSNQIWVCNFCGYQKPWLGLVGDKMVPTQIQLLSSIRSEVCHQEFFAFWLPEVHYYAMKKGIPFVYE